MSEDKASKFLQKESQTWLITNDLVSGTKRFISKFEATRNALQELQIYEMPKEKLDYLISNANHISMQTNLLIESLNEFSEKKEE